MIRRGLCTIVDGRLERRRAEGKLDNLAARARRRRRCPAMSASPIPAGRPMARRRVGNAHPHVVDGVARGPQRHHREFQAAARGAAGQGPPLRERDRHRGRRPSRRRPARGRARRPQEAVAAVLPRLHGAFALAILFRDHPDMIDRRAARRAARRRLWRGRELSRLRRARARRADPAASPISTKATGRSSPTTRSQIFDRDNQPVDARDGRIRRQRGARSRRAITAISCRRRFSSSRSSSPRRCGSYLRPLEQKVALPRHGLLLRAGAADHHRRLRHLLLCRHGRQILARALRPRAGRPRCRQRVPLPRAGARAGRARAVHLPVGRDRRHARRAPPRPRPGPEDRGRGQRADQLDGARGGPAAADPCRPRDRRRLDQGLHLPARRARRARRQGRARQGRDERGGGARDRPPSDRGAGRDERRARP